MSRCEAPFEPPCQAEATTVGMLETDTFLVCDQCRRDLGDFDAYHVERGLAGPLEAFESWTGKP